MLLARRGVEGGGDADIYGVLAMRTWWIRELGHMGGPMVASAMRG